MDFSSSRIFLAISLGTTRNAVFEPRILRFLWLCAQLHWELREMLPPNCGFHVVTGSLRNFMEMRETPSAICGFRVVTEIREMPPPNCGYRVVHSTSRNFIEMREMPPPKCGFHVACGISRNFSRGYEQCRFRTVDFVSPTIFRAISSRITNNAVSKLRVLLCQRYFAKFFWEIRKMPSPNGGFRVVDFFHAIWLRVSRNTAFNSSIWRFSVQNVDFTLVF